jgi:hypothetical protein
MEIKTLMSIDFRSLLIMINSPPYPLSDGIEPVKKNLSYLSHDRE